MATPISFQEMLNVTPLTQFIEKVATGIPKVLPEKFYTTTKNVIGNKTKNITYSGTRKTARVQPYGAEPRRVNMSSMGGEEFQLLAAAETLRADQNFLQMILLMKENALLTADSVQDELNRQGVQFATRFTNLRTAAIHSLVANGKIWFDVNGNLLATSAGADLEIDFGTPAGNRGDIGGRIGAPWSTASTPIMQQMTNICVYLRQLTGYKPKYAFYGKNIPQYMMQNTTLQQYFARNQGFRDRLIETRQIPDGMFDLTWIPVYDAFYETDSGTITEQFDGDAVTLCPEIDPQTYSMYQGSMFVPKSIQPMDDITQAMGNLQVVYGMGRYCVPILNPIAFDFNIFDTFLPRWNVPSAVAFLDTVP